MAVVVSKLCRAQSLVHDLLNVKTEDQLKQVIANHDAENLFQNPSAPIDTKRLSKIINSLEKGFSTNSTVLAALAICSLNYDLDNSRTLDQMGKVLSLTPRSIEEIKFIVSNFSTGRLFEKLLPNDADKLSAHSSFALLMKVVSADGVSVQPRQTEPQYSKDYKSDSLEQLVPVPATRS